MKKVRLGLIGCGAMGVRHAAAAVASNVIELIAIADPMAQRAQELAAQHQVPSVYDDGNKLLEDSTVDAVVLAMPTFLRGPIAHKAFECGKHVLLEKPAAMDVPELEGLITARGNLVAASASSRYRFLPSVAKIAQFLQGDDDPLGPIRSVFVRDFSPAKPKPEKEKHLWRLKKELNGGGVFVNWGCYDLDYMLGLLGWSLKPQQVNAQTWTIAPTLASHVPESTDAETHVVAFIRCEGGPVIHYERGEYIPLQTPCKAWKIIGTRGAIRLQLRGGEAKQIHYDYLDSDQGSATKVIWEGDEDDAIVHGRPVQDFCEAILETRPPRHHA